MMVERIRIKTFVKHRVNAEIKIYNGPSTDNKHFIGNIFITNEILGRKKRYWGLVIEIPKGMPFAIRNHNEDRCKLKVLRSQRGFSRLCEIGVGGPKMLPCEHHVPPRGCTSDNWEEEAS